MVTNFYYLQVHPTYAMHGFFIHGFPKLIRFQAHHDKVLKKFEKNLKRHMDKQGIESGIYTIKWFFQCFLDRVSKDYGLNHLYHQNVNEFLPKCFID